MKFNLCVVAICLTLSFGLCVGCGPAKDKSLRVVRGTVTLGGTPVEGATVTFFPQDASGSAATGYSDASGNYVLTSLGATEGGGGTKPGKYRVTVSKLEQIQDNTANLTREQRDALMDSPPVVPKQLLPVIYNDAQKTPLEVTVAESGTSVIDLALEKK